MPDKKKIPPFRYKSSNWYSGSNIDDSEYSHDDWQVSQLSITAPGTRSDHEDYIEFVAENFIPRGEIRISHEIYDLLYMVKEYCRDSKVSGACTKATISMRPYTGDVRCYTKNDILTTMGYMNFEFDPSALKFLRNEIFARKGYEFKTELMQNYFSEMAWYKPSHDNVQLNNFEKWNVKYLKSIENKIVSDYYQKTLWSEVDLDELIDEVAIGRDPFCE